jgi:Ca2+-binding RTX toxin-like protein
MAGYVLIPFSCPTGEDDNDTYLFKATALEVLDYDQVIEGVDAIAGTLGGDLLDFTDLVPASGSTGVAVDLGSILQVNITTSSQLQLKLSSGSTIERATGSNSGADRITGNGAANILRGLNLNDTLIGNAGNDTLYGGNGDDDLTGGGGTDILYGDADNDTFHTAGDGLIDTLYGGTGEDTATDRDTNDVNPLLDIEHW